MNRITDVILSTQLCTFFAAVCAYCAHMIENGSWLNPNWGFAVYLLLGFGTAFMLLPHLICQGTVKHYQQLVEANMLKAQRLNEAYNKICNLTGQNSVVVKPFFTEE